MLNQLLSEMDGFAANTGVILLSATNRPEVLDPALLRPGKFDSAKRRLRQRQIVVDRPDKSGRQAILVVHARNVKMSDDVNLLKLAARTPGFAGADLANLVNEAALLAARHDRVAVTMSDFEEAIERILTGLEKKSRVLNEIEKETVAYHEVGHAIVGSLMPGSGSSLFHRGFCPEKISIVPRGVAALGYTLQLPQEDRFLMVEDELRGQIAMLLGGRSADSARLRQREVKYLIDNAHRIAGAILAHNQPLLTEMAQVLLEREILVGQQLHDYLVGGASPLENRVNIPPLLATWLQTGEISIDPRMVEIGKSFNSQHLQEH